MGRDENTPIWTQHLALKVDSEETLSATKQKLIDAGLEVLGPVNHTLFKSIYFFDPNGHRVELACDITTDQMNRALDKVKWDMLNEWAQTKKHPNTHNGYMMAQSRLMCDGFFLTKIIRSFYEISNIKTRRNRWQFGCGQP